MESTYTGTVKESNKKVNGKFNVSALILWLCTLVVSLIPIGIEMLEYLNINGKIDSMFWLQCFVEGDLLWTFSTLVLFSVMNYFSRQQVIKANILVLIALSVFALTEALWFFFRYSVTATEGTMWPIILGTICVIFSLIIATPLQIDFIRNEGEK